MKKVNLAFWAVLTVSATFLSGCSKNITEGENVNAEITEIVGSTNFYSSISCLNNIETKAGEVAVDDILDTIQPLFVSAKEYLTLNGYNYLEDFEENDPNIILTAFALMETDFADQMPNTKISATTVLSCVFLGEPVAGLAKTGAALIAKRLASRIIEKAIPYVGAAVWVATSGACLYENW